MASLTGELIREHGDAPEEWSRSERLSTLGTHA